MRSGPLFDVFRLLAEMDVVTVAVLDGSVNVVSQGADLELKGTTLMSDFDEVDLDCFV
jgi:hypothetical protein